MAIQADIVFRNAYVITLDDERRVYRNGHVAVAGDSIVSVGRDEEWNGQAARTVNAAGKAILPGLVNAHNHVNQILFRGWNDDGRAEGGMAAFAAFQIDVWKHAGEDLCNKMVRLHALDMIKGGTTATHEQHFTNLPLENIDGVIRALDESGMRAFISRCHINDPIMVPAEAHETVDFVLKEVERLRAAYHNNRIEITASPINPSWVRTDDELIALREGIRAIGVPFDIDLNGDNFRMTMDGRGFAGGAVAYCDTLGILDNQTLGGKSFNMLLDEYAIWAARGVKACMVPMGRMQRELGIALHHFLANGVVPGLGTDAPGSHTTTSLWEVMRLCLLATTTRKIAEARAGITDDAQVPVTPEIVLEMATIAGARALFLDERVNGLAVGRAADLVAIDIDSPAFAPRLDDRRLLTTLVGVAEAAMVDTVMVDGRILVEGGRSTVWDEEQIVAEAEEAARTIYQRAGFSNLLPSRGTGETFRGWSYL